MRAVYTKCNWILIHSDIIALHLNKPAVIVQKLTSKFHKAVIESHSPVYDLLSRWLFIPPFDRFERAYQIMLPWKPSVCEAPLLAR